MSTSPAIYSNGTTPPEFYYIAPHVNVPTILKEGILSKKRSTAFALGDISDGTIQQRRVHKIVPNAARERAGKRALVIHRHANLYVRAHNAMAYVRKNERDTICVLRIDPAVLRRPEVVISSLNAAKDTARFEPATDFKFSPESTEMLLEPTSYFFKDKQTPGKEEKRKAVRQAEVLVPYQLHPSYIRGIYVANEMAKQNLLSQLGGSSPVPIDIHPTLFFLEEMQKTPAGFNPLIPIQAQPLNNTQYPALVMELPVSSDEEDASVGSP